MPEMDRDRDRKDRDRDRKDRDRDRKDRDRDRKDRDRWNLTETDRNSIHDSRFKKKILP